MNELYEYLSSVRDQMYASGKKTVEIDMDHLFWLHRVVCYMLQIKNIINFDDDIAMMVKQIRSDRMIEEIKRGPLD